MESTIAVRPGDAIVLGDLMAECATFPEVAFAWADPQSDPQWDPEVFASRVLGVVVPVESVLDLCGIMAGEGRGAVLGIESLDRRYCVVLVSRARRFGLFLDRGWATELCPTPGCSAEPIHEHIPRCHHHLVDCDPDELARAAGEYGWARREELDRDPARMVGDPHADLLARAAAANGAAEPVATAYLDGLFDPDTINDAHWDPTEALAVRHALERERLRLRRIADRETRDIRSRARTCTTCGKELSPWPAPVVPPRFCALTCVPSPSGGRLTSATPG